MKVKWDPEQNIVRKASEGSIFKREGKLSKLTRNHLSIQLGQPGQQRAPHIGSTSLYLGKRWGLHLWSGWCPGRVASLSSSRVGGERRVIGNRGQKEGPGEKTAGIYDGNKLWVHKVSSQNKVRLFHNRFWDGSDIYQILCLKPFITGTGKQAIF